MYSYIFFVPFFGIWPSKQCVLLKLSMWRACSVLRPYYLGIWVGVLSLPPSKGKLLSSHVHRSNNDFSSFVIIIAFSKSEKNVRELQQNAVDAFFSLIVEVFSYKNAYIFEFLGKRWERDKCLDIPSYCLLHCSFCE